MLLKVLRTLLRIKIQWSQLVILFRLRIRESCLFIKTGNYNFWFGSKEQGLYRYDGKYLRHFTMKDGLCDNRILSIQEDKSGNMYFDTGGGISKFDGQAFSTLPLLAGGLLTMSGSCSPTMYGSKAHGTKTAPIVTTANRCII